jgi:DNA mismatch endonuclease, patch repair protein
MLFWVGNGPLNTHLVTTPQRSLLMSGIRSKNTHPEIIVRKALHKLGYRFRLHVRELPGCPDIVLSKHRTVLQVKGCFWHSHHCIGGRMPATNRHYWVPKLRNNKSRDKRNDRKLRALGWRVITIWECRIRRVKMGTVEALVKKVMMDSRKSTSS